MVKVRKVSQVAALKGFNPMCMKMTQPITLLKAPHLNKAKTTTTKQQKTKEDFLATFDFFPLLHVFVGTVHASVCVCLLR